METLEDHPGTTWSENTGAELTQGDVYYHYYGQKTENNDLKPGYVIHSILEGLSLFQKKIPRNNRAILKKVVAKAGRRMKS